jgi:hypothetical protein
MLLCFAPRRSLVDARAILETRVFIYGSPYQRDHRTAAKTALIDKVDTFIRKTNGARFLAFSFSTTRWFHGRRRRRSASWVHMAGPVETMSSARSSSCVPVFGSDIDP